MDRNEPSEDTGLSLPFMERGSGNDSGRIPFASRMNDTFRNHFVACCGEFIGTFFFLFFGLSGAQVASTAIGHKDEINKIMYISVSFGFSLAVNVWVMYRVSGGLFNPAVSISSYPMSYLLLLIAFSSRSRSACVSSEHYPGLEVHF